jgi:alpha-mannosidase
MRVHMIGNAHIDPVWLWPWQAGADEALATLASAADRCAEYPQFVFTRGEAWLYRQVERVRPDLFVRIQALIAGGQWHVTGGQFIQPDLNLPTKAGLDRQFMYGQRYFREAFGIAPTVAYNVDSFGHTATLPDILTAHGYDAYVFRRPEQHQVALPANTFVWRGVGGGEVVAFRINPAYVANFTDLSGQVEIAVESADPALGHTMCFYGVGNHGGGPSKAMIEWILAHSSFGGHELVFSTPAAFFAAIADKRHLLPVVTSELQHTFPGCYSVMHDIKSAQRHGENLLVQAEAAARAFAADEAARTDHLARLDRAWEDLLFTQFHDVLTGTSIPSAWGSVRAMQGRARMAGEEVLYEATRRWSYRTLPRVSEQQIVVVNPSEEAWTGYVEAEPYLDFDDWRERWIADESGAPVPFQQIQPDANQLIPRVLFRTTVGPQQSRQLQVRSDARPAAAPVTGVTGSPERLANADVAVRLGASGISSLAYKGREVLGEGGISLHLRRDTTDTWTFHTDRWEEAIEERLAAGTWQLEEEGPLRARARLDARLGTSRLSWSVSVYHDEPRVAVGLTVNFDERFRLLQMPVQLAAPPAQWTDGLAGGHIDRTPDPTEWPFLGWSRLDLGGLAIGLVTQDVYSHSVDGALWQPTLLRSPKMAWGGGQPAVYAGRDQHTDQGVHRFVLDLWLGDALPEAELAARAARQGQPPVVFDRYEGMNRPAWGDVPPRGLWGPAMERNLAAGRVADPGEEKGGLFRRPGVDYAG